MTTARSGEAAPLLDRVARHVTAVSWERAGDAVRARAPLVVLDALGCAFAGHERAIHDPLVRRLAAAGGGEDATIWVRGARVPAAHAALVNGTVAHHVELDDGNPRASLHGGVTIVPAAAALAEWTGASGAEFLASIVAGYDAAVACGRPLLPGLTRHRLHPPGVVGCFGAAAAAARVLRLDVRQTAHALALAGTLVPMAPFESFTKGAVLKDLYGGWPAYVGTTAALLARHGLEGPVDLFETPADGPGAFLLHDAIHAADDPDPDELLHVQFKAYATCRSVQPALTALEQILPLDAGAVASIDVETYPFAAALSAESVLPSPVGAKTSIPYCIASYIVDGDVGPASFDRDHLSDPTRLKLADRVTVSVASDMADPVVRGARVTVTLAGGERRRGEAGSARWSEDTPATGAELRTKFRRLAGRAADRVEQAVDALAGAPNLAALVGATIGNGA